MTAGLETAQSSLVPDRSRRFEIILKGVSHEIGTKGSKVVTVIRFSSKDMSSHCQKDLPFHQIGTEVLK